VLPAHSARLSIKHLAYGDLKRRSWLVTISCWYSRRALVSCEMAFVQFWYSGLWDFNIEIAVTEKYMSMGSLDRTVKLVDRQ
jgi:hypothetical protein